jgi:hypothetical protein
MDRAVIAATGAVPVRRAGVGGQLVLLDAEDRGAPGESESAEQEKETSEPHHHEPFT